ncbi:DUF805 domain-containing protein [bacterium]|nr:DUF805 domain-containing protein [bacterium]
MIIPFLSATVRRLHDISRSGWMILVKLIPIFGTIWLLLFLRDECDIGTNYLWIGS